MPLPRNLLFAASLLLLSRLASSCGPGDPAEDSTAGTGAVQRPKWVDDPGAYYEAPRPDVVLAVGKAPIRGAEAPARIAAAATARVALLKSLQRDPAGASANDVVDSSHAEDRVDGTLSGSRVLAYWKEDRTLYALVSAPAAAHQGATGGGAPKNP